MVELESGFNPNAANPQSSATGLGQFIDSTGKSRGITNENRWDVDTQINALVQQYTLNKAVAEKNNLGEAGIYGAHHDGAGGVLKPDAPGIELANSRVLPQVGKYEQLIDNRIASGDVPSGYAAVNTLTPNPNLGTVGGSIVDEVVIVAKRPVDIAGDAIDAELPDGTRVVSTSTTVNGQTTVTADLVDKDGRVLLHAGAGQTMERDPDTGIVQVRTGTSDQVQQYDPATGEVSNTLRTGSDSANVYDNLLDVFSNPQVPTDKGVQVADASDATGAGMMTDAGWIPAGGVGLPTTAQPEASSQTNTNTLGNYLDSQGNTLNPAQQQALATQIDKLGLGGEGDLSFYSLPNGGALIANADGDIVGEINRNSATGDLQLKATGIDADGNSVEVNNHIGEQGQVMSDAAVVQGQASNMFNSLMAVNNWGHLSDLGKLSALVNLYNATDKLGEAFGATGDNLPGDLGAAAGYLQLAQGLQSGDNLIIANGLNTVSGGAVDQAIGNVVGEQLPYVSTLLELRNFADNPEQAMLTMAGTYVGEAIGMAIGGPIGAAIGGAIGGMIGGSLGSALGLGDDPPAPAGAAHFSWDANGHIQHTVDYSQSGGGEVANSVAASVQSMLEQVVAAANAKNPSTADDIAINPYCLPRVSFQAGAGGAMMEVTLSNGHVAGQQVDSPQFAEWLLKVVQDTGGLAPAWQVQTEQVKWQQAHAQVEQLQAQRDALLTTAEVPTEDGVQTVQSVLPAQAEHYAQLQIQIEQAQERLTQLQTEFDKGLGVEAQSLQGHAIESADFKSQTFGALVVHLHDDAGVQAAQAQLTQVLRDIDGDGYFEKTQWVSATDAQGKQQGLLTLDANGDGVIDTSDILNLGGNADHSSEGDSQLIPITSATALATENADLQHNNIAWLDANGDGVIDKADPAFAAIKLWVDVNQDGKLEAGESQNLDVLQIKSINFKTGEISYLDGSTDALTAATLTGDTEGIKLTQIQQADANGELHALDAGDVLEHEGYQGKVEVTDASGTHWIDQRNQTYEQQAKRTGDWEGTAEQEAHRHGGGNVEGAPTETTATGATDFGPVKTQANVITQSTVEEGDARVVSDEPTQAPTLPPKANAQTTVAAGDSRVTSNASAANATANTSANSASNTASNPRIAFVPTAQTSVQSEIRTVTDNMIESSQSMLFGGGSASLGVLAAVGTGATASAASAAEVAQRVVSEVRSSDANTNSTAVTNPVSSNNTFSTTASTPSNASADTSTPVVTFKQVDLGVLYVPPVGPASTPAAAQQNTATSTAPTNHDTPSTTFVQATVIVSAPATVPVVTNKAAASTPTTTTTPTPEAAPDKAALSVAVAPAAASAPTLGYPVVQAETLPGTEDVVLRLNPSVLLANDSTPNASADPTQPALTITAVAAPVHGQVSLVDGEVLFAPDANFHGTASFTYTVTDQYGLSSDGTATLVIAAVNDAPVTQGEGVASDEDVGLIFTQAQLLANDRDVDVATDGQVLSVSRVGEAQHGTVWLDEQGQIRFVPDANYHGPAQFTYWVSDGAAVDGAGAETPATVNLTIAAVNDAPVVQGDAVATNEDTPLLIPAATLLANDSDVDVATDGQVLSLSAVSAIAGETHGSVSLVTQADGTQQVQFTPDANYHGTAKFNYTVSDGNGGFATAVATVNVAAVNDAPVTQGETYTSDEDIGLIFTQAQLLANDSDVDVATDGQVLSISRVGEAQHGTVWLDAQGNLRFVPEANYHGPAQFTYWVSDGTAAEGGGAETPATMRLTIAAVNDVPVAQGETTTSTEDTTLLINAATLLANDSDVDVTTDNQVLSISGLSNAAHCTVSLVTLSNGTQQITFVPDANYHGTATFDYTVDDGNGGTAVATAVVTLSAVNDAPVTTGETATSDEDTPLLFTSVDLLANDTDADIATDGQVLSISRVGNATHGSVILDAQGQVHFTPEANYHGPAQFTYWVSDGAAADGAGAEVPATVSLTILAVNDLPVVTGETVNTNEDTTLLFDPATLLSNDSDVDVATDNQVLSITAVSNATHGTVAFVTQSDGIQRIAFTPEANYFGVASYQYTVSDGNGGTATTTVVVNLTQVNDTPIAADDNLNSTAEDTALHISFTSLLGNDTDADSLNAQWGGVNDVLTVSAVGNATHGTVTIVDGEVVFTPEANYHGAASFAYQVTDSSGAVSQALATFSVTAVNDLPVALGETIVSNEDTTLLISQAALLQNDSDVDTGTDGQVLSITDVSNAQHGTVTLNSDGSISFVPEANFYGNASFDYTVSDGNGGATTTTATIALANVNDAPVATGETVYGSEDQVLTITASALLQNDSDIDNVQTDLTISRVQSGTGGTVSLNASGNVVFTPTTNYNGTANFTYWVKDPGGLESNAVTTTVVLAAVNDAPSAQGEIVTGASEDAVFNINKATLLANDHDIDDPDSALSLSWVGNATGGSVSLDASGNVVFTPTANFNGNATFQYKVRDAAGLESAVVQAVIPVAAVNDAPVAVDDRFTTYNNSTLTVAFNQLTSNDTDVEGDALTVSAVRDHANGHASIVNGQVQFVADAGFVGAASFDYLADDGHGGKSLWATAFVDVKTPPNLYPTVEVTSTLFQGTNSGVIDIAYGAWHAVDDGNAGAVTFSVQQVIVSGGYYGSTWSAPAGATQYHFYSTYMYLDVRSWLAFTQLKTTWLLTDDRGLQNIWHFDYDIATGYRSYTDHMGYYSPPVILDLNGDGVHFTSLQNSNVKMDVNFDGIQDKMAWAGNDDGVLVWDKDHNHQISDTSEFAFQTLKADAQTDLEGLQALDTNGNGLLDTGDAKFAEFAVWQDANGNGVTDAGEFKTLTELGIASINLHSDGQMRDAGTLLANSGSGETDATVMGNAAFTRTDGSTGVVADTMLAYELGHATPVAMPTTAADAQAAEIMRQALLFNQVCNTAVATDNTPLGFVPIEPDVQLNDMLVTPQDGSHQLSHAA